MAALVLDGCLAAIRACADWAASMALRVSGVPQLGDPGDQVTRGRVASPPA